MFAHANSLFLDLAHQHTAVLYMVWINYCSYFNLIYLIRKFRIVLPQAVIDVWAYKVIVSNPLRKSLMSFHFTLKRLIY